MVNGAMKERTTTLELDERGRVTIPQPTRKALGIDGREAIVEATIRYDENENENETGGV